MNIRFYQKDGRIGAKYTSYLEDLGDLGRFASGLLDLHQGDIGFVPVEVQEQGEAAVRLYAHKACKKHHQEQIRGAKVLRTAAYERMNSVDRIIQVSHEGVLLKGRMINHKASGGVIVTLEAPFASEDGCVFDYPTCFAQSVRGLRVFDLHTGELTHFVLRDAEDALVQLYRSGVAKQKHPEAVNVVAALNKERQV